MEVSSNTTQSSVQMDTMKKAMQSQEDVVAKMLETARQEAGVAKQTQEQQQMDTAQKTGMGNSLDIKG